MRKGSSWTVRGEVYVGNHGGNGLARMKAMLDAHESEIKELKNDGKELRAQVHTLSLAAEDYRRARQRFISMFKQDKLPDQMQESDYRIIKMET